MRQSPSAFAAFCAIRDNDKITKRSTVIKNNAPKIAFGASYPNLNQTIN